MLGIEQFGKIQEYRKLGISKLKVSEILDLSYKTVSNWWEKTEEDFYAFQSEHEFMLDNYRQYIIEILKICPQISNTVLLRRVKDDFDDFNVPTSTFYRYVKKLREQTGYIKPSRKFASRTETEPGYEGQVDFGQYVMKTMYGNHIRAYFFCMTLSFSRMKFAYFSIEPFTAKTTIIAHDFAFKYFGGRPQMLVYDQDKTMVVSENFGDVIFVKEFEDYIKDTGFSIYLCKGYDPSTKGKVEKTVDFIKHLFLDGRIYCGIDRLNAECLMWLDKEGNAIINDTTKKIPKDLYRKEASLLQKVYERKNEDIVVTSVNKSTVTYLDVMYGLPKAKVTDGERVRIERLGDDLLIYRSLSSEVIYKHKFRKEFVGVVPCVEKEDHNDSSEDEMKSIFRDNEIGMKFLELMRKQKPRYVYPQCRRLQRMRKYYTDFQMTEGMEYCLSVKTATVFELCCYLMYKYGEEISRKFLREQTFKTYHKRMLEIREAKMNG